MSRIAPDCTVPAIAVKTEPIEQLPSGWLALVDETFVALGWKQDYVAALLGKDPAQLSRAMHEKDGKAFDLRWLDRLPLEFHIALHRLMAKKFGITTESRTDVLLGSLKASLDSLYALAQNTVVEP